MTARTLFGLTLIEGLTWVMVLCAAVSLIIVVADLIPAKPRPDPAHTVHTPDWHPYDTPVVVPALVVGPGRHRSPRVHTIFGEAAAALARGDVELAAHLEAVERGGAR